MGRPFADCNCVGLLESFYSRLGADLPQSFAQMTSADYLDTFRRRPRWCQAQLVKLVKGLGEPADHTRPQLFDLVLFLRGKSIFPAAYCGRGLYMTSTLREGVVMIRAGRHNRPLLARRLI